MPDPQQQYDVVGMRVGDICGAIVDQKLSGVLADLCECIKNYGQQPGVSPCDSWPFTWQGSIAQTEECFIASTAGQVPKGLIGTITRVSFQERYPGSLYGASFWLVINDNISPEFPKIDRPVGQSGSGIGTRICLEEQDMVSILIQCSWTPTIFVGQAATYVQMLYPFVIEGFFQNKIVATPSPSGEIIE